MTISAEKLIVAKYNGDGSTTAFTFAFRAFTATDIVVSRRSTSGVESVLVLNTDYTVAINGTGIGGTVTCTRALAVGEVLAISRNVKMTQLLDLENQGAFFAEDHEGEFDKLTAIAQDIAEREERTLRVDVTDSRTPGQVLSDIFTARDTAVQKASEASGSATTASQKADEVTAKYNLISPHFTAIDGLYADRTNLDTVAASISNVDTVGTNISNVNAVASNATNINTVAGDKANIDAVAADLENIDAASGYAAEAKKWAIGDPSEPTDGNSAKWHAEHTALDYKGLYSASTTYSKNEYVSNSTVGTSKYYVSLVNNNLGNDLTDTTKWGFLWQTNIGDQVSWGNILGTLSNQSDLQSALDAKFNVSGGTITGNITLYGADLLKRVNNASSTSILGGANALDGACVKVYGKTASGHTGDFEITAHDGTNGKTLLGKSNGDLLWNGVPVSTYQDATKFYSSVASMKADTKLASGMAVATLGYYSENDGGGALYAIKSSTSSFAETLSNGLYAELVLPNGVANVKQFGAKGDGTTDDTAAIQAALDSGCSSVLFHEGEYKVTESLEVSSNTSIVGNATILAQVDAYEAAFITKGTEGSSLSVLSSISKNDTTFTLSSADAATLSAGDFVKIISTEHYAEALGVDYLKGEMVRVESVSGGTVTIQGNGFALPYTVGEYTVVAKKLSMAENISIEGLKIKGQGGDNRQVGIQIEKCNNGSVKNCELFLLEVGVNFNDSIYSSCVSSCIHDCIRASSGYGVEVCGVSQSIRVSNNSFYRNRHSFTTAGDNGVCLYIHVSDNVIENNNYSSQPALDTHNNARFVCFSGNTIVNCGQGINIRSPYTTVVGNTIYRVKGYGIRAYDAGGINIKIENNTVNESSRNYENAISVGIGYVGGDSPDYVSVVGNVVSSAPNGGGIEISSNSSSIKQCVVNSNLIESVGYSNISITNARYSTISSNMVGDSSRNAYSNINVTGPDSGQSYVSIVGNCVPNGNSTSVTLTKLSKATVQSNFVSTDSLSLTNVGSLDSFGYLQSPNGTTYKLSVTNAGDVTATSL